MRVSVTASTRSTAGFFHSPEFAKGEAGVDDDAKAVAVEMFGQVSQKGALTKRLSTADGNALGIPGGHPADE